MGVYEAQRHRVLELARTHLGMDAAWESEFVGADQVFTTVKAGAGASAPMQGSASPLATSYCVRVLDGRLPAVIPNTRAQLTARDLPGTVDPGIGAYVGVPVRLNDGRVRGMLCCVSADPRPGLSESDSGVLEMLAELLADIANRENQEAASVEAPSRILEAINSRAWHTVLHPVVDVHSGGALGVEALTRFHGEPTSPAAWFSEASRLGLGVELELATATSALHTPRVGAGLVGVNLSPEAIVSRGFMDIFNDVDPAGIVVEITEHAPVPDYAAVLRALAPLRRRGLGLAIDDAGAGYASFRHILRLQPDYIKIDISLVRDIDQDPVLAALVASLVTFGRAAGAQLVAEGVETQAELDTLASLGVTLAQGYLYGMPSTTPRLSGHPTPSLHTGGSPAAEVQWASTL
jgi:EAL domain-containing protein (putative c-di-GMP-specific phosphodiesterase class I)